MAKYCIVSEIKRDIDRKSRFFHSPFYINNRLGKMVANTLALLFFTPEPDPWPVIWCK